MGLRMKNCIMGFTEKSDFQGVSKNQYIGEELGSLQIGGGGLGKKEEGGVFERGEG